MAIPRIESHVAGSESHVAGSESHVARSESHVAESECHVARSESHATGSESLVARSECHVTGSESQVAGSEPNVTGSESHVAGSGSHGPSMGPKWQLRTSHANKSAQTGVGSQRLCGEFLQVCCVTHSLFIAIDNQAKAGDFSIKLVCLVLLSFSLNVSVY